MKLVITLNVLDEALLRKVASARTNEEASGPSSEARANAKLHELAFEALYSSNPDPICPADAGFEVLHCSDAGSYADIIKIAVAANIFDEGALRDEAVERMKRCDFGGDTDQLRAQPLGELLYQTMIGCSFDDLSPLDMGIEIGNWEFSEEAHSSQPIEATA